MKASRFFAIFSSLGFVKKDHSPHIIPQEGLFIPSSLPSYLPVLKEKPTTQYDSIFLDTPPRRESVPPSCHLGCIVVIGVIFPDLAWAGNQSTKKVWHPSRAAQEEGVEHKEGARDVVAQTILLCQQALVTKH